MSTYLQPKTVSAAMQSIEDVLGEGTLTNGLTIVQGNILYGSAAGTLSVLAPGTSGQYLKTQGASANPVWATISGSYEDKKNLAIIVNATNPIYQIDIDADYLMVEDQALSSVNLTVDITTSGANGLDTGTEASSTWYSIWVIYNPTTSTTAGLLSTSATAPTMPSGYTKKRRVGWVRNDASSNFLKFYQIGDWWWWDDDIQVLNTVTPATTYTDVDCSSAAPPTAELLNLALLGEDNDSTDYQIHIRRNGSTGPAEVTMYLIATGASAVYINTTTIQSSDSSQIIEYYTATGDRTTMINVLAYYDPI